MHKESVKHAHRRNALYTGFVMPLSENPEEKPLIESRLRKIKAPYSGKIEIAGRDDLSVRNTPNAVITSNYRFRCRGKQQRIKIGRYPDIKLSDARIKAGEYRQALLDGLAPRSYSVNQKKVKLLGELCDNFMQNTPPMHYLLTRLFYTNLFIKST